MEILRFLGRGLLALGAFILEILAGLVRAIAHGLGDGLAVLFRATGPYLVGGGALYILWVYRPEVVIGIVQTVIVCALIFFGVRMIFRGAFASPKKSNKKGS